MHGFTGFGWFLLGALGCFAMVGAALLAGIWLVKAFAHRLELAEIRREAELAAAREAAKTSEEVAREMRWEEIDKQRAELLRGWRAGK